MSAEEISPEDFRIPTVGELDQMRVALGLSQRELSRRAGCGEGRFHAILHRGMDPQTDTMRSFLDVLQTAEPTEPEDIDRTGPKPRPSKHVEQSKTPDEYETVAGALSAMDAGDLGEDPRPPEVDPA